MDTIINTQLKTKEQIIQETVDFYSADSVGRRGVSISNNYVYETKDGKKCAVGRCLNPDKIRISELYSNVKTIGSLENIGAIILEDILMPEYKGHDINFWSDLQSFHDDSTCWDYKGLTVWGNNCLTKLKSTWLND